MNPINKALLALFFYSSFLHGQNSNHEFISYLYANNFETEHKHALKNNSLNLSPDSLSYYKALFYLDQNNPDLFLKHYKTSKILIDQNSCALNNASALLVNDLNEENSDWFNQLSALKDSNTIKLKELYGLIINDSSDIPELPDNLSYYRGEYLKYKDRKPVLAALLSASVPGLGKIYNGRKRGFWLSFSTNLTFGVQAAESIYKLGIAHPYSIVTTSIFSIFYLSNVFGSYYDMKKVKIEKRNELLHQISSYYSNNCSLY